MTTEQKRNYIILIIVLILIVGGVYYRKYKSNPSLISPYQGRNEVQNDVDVPLIRGNEGVVSVNPQPKLTYEQYLQQGINFETKNDLNSAISSYKKAAELSPKEYVPYSNAGSAYYSMGKFTEAEKHFLKALELSPDSVSVHTKLYDLYFYGLKRSPEQMKAFFVDSLKDTNNDINIVKLYTIYLEKIEDFKPALSIWRSLLDFEPDNESYKTKVEALQKQING